MKPSILLSIILAAAILFMPLSSSLASPAAVLGTRCYVNANATGEDTGVDWTNAYTDLQSALAPASPCTEIWVAAGTYTPTDTTSRTSSFDLKSGVAVYGGFVGGETSVLQRNVTAHETILSGDIGTVGNSDDNVYHVVDGSYANSTARLDGFTIRDGNANNGAVHWAYASGAGVFNVDPNPSSPTCGPTFDYVTIINNSASNGAGMYNFYCDPSISHFNISYNTATNYGGGVWNYQSHPTLYNGNVTFNTATAHDGGGLYLYHQSSVTISYVLFDHNKALNGDGGAVLLDGGTGSSFNAVGLTYNSASFAGGGLAIRSTNPVIDYLTVTANTAAIGAGVSIVQGSPQITHSTFYQNQASSMGGGLHLADASSTLTLSSDTFQSNQATHGAGIYNAQGVLSLTDGAFIENHADASTGSGGGIVNDGGNVTLTRVNFNDNTAANGGGMNTGLGSANLTDVSFKGNQAAGGGGGIASNDTALAISKATFEGNGSSGTCSGGGLSNDNHTSSAAVTLKNITFNANTAQNGGAIYNYGPISVYNVTVAGNTASVHGGAIFTQTAFDIYNSILWDNGTELLYNNSGNPAENVRIHDGLVEGGCPDGATCSPNPPLTDDPELGPLQNNGGFTKTMALSSSSPAIDAGNNATCAETDQRGFLRPLDGDHDGTATCDIGAYELGLQVFLPLVFK